MSEQVQTAQEAAPEAASLAPAPAQDAPSPAAQNTPNAAAERPAWLPEKFKSPEDLARAYADLERKLGQRAAPAEPKAEGTPKPRVSAAEAEAVVGTEAESKVRGAALDPDALDEEFASRGALSPETIAKAEAAGVSREFLSRYVEARAVLIERQAEELMAVAGGREQWGKIAEWARANLPERALATFNEAVSRGSMEMAKLAIEGIVARYTAANANVPKLIGGTAAGPSGFRSAAEIKQAMADPRYATDPTYREEVQSRLRASTMPSVRAF